MHLNVKPNKLQSFEFIFLKNDLVNDEGISPSISLPYEYICAYARVYHRSYNLFIDTVLFLFELKSLLHEHVEHLVLFSAPVHALFRQLIR